MALRKTKNGREVIPGCILCFCLWMFFKMEAVAFGFRMVLKLSLLLPKGGLESAAASAQRRGSAETLSYRLSFGSQINPLLPQVGDLGGSHGAWGLQ